MVSLKRRLNATWNRAHRWHEEWRFQQLLLLQYPSKWSGCTATDSHLCSANLGQRPFLDTSRVQSWGPRLYSGTTVSREQDRSKLLQSNLAKAPGADSARQ